MKSCSRMFEPLWTVEPLNQCARVPRRSSVGAFQTVESGEQLSYERRFEQVIGNSPALEEVLEQVERVAPTDSTVLIQGETGTGKELIAHAIHNISSRCGRPFVRLNSSAIQPYEGTSAARADVVNRVRDQLLAGACFSLDKNGGIRRCHTFDLFEHLFQSRTVAYDLLESALIRKLLTTLDSLESSHRGPPGYACALVKGFNCPERLEHSRAGLHRRT